MCSSGSSGLGVSGKSTPATVGGDVQTGAEGHLLTSGLPGGQGQALASGSSHLFTEGE